MKLTSIQVRTTAHGCWHYPHVWLIVKGTLRLESRMSLEFWLTIA